MNKLYLNISNEDKYLINDIYRNKSYKFKNLLL